MAAKDKEVKEEVVIQSTEPEIREPKTISATAAVQGNAVADTGIKDAAALLIDKVMVKAAECGYDLATCEMRIKVELQRGAV